MPEAPRTDYKMSNKLVDDLKSPPRIGMRLDGDNYSMGLRQGRVDGSQSESSVKTSSKFNSGFMEKRKKVKKSLNMDRFKIRQFDITSETSQNIQSDAKQNIQTAD